MPESPRRLGRSQRSGEDQPRRQRQQPKCAALENRAAPWFVRVGVLDVPLVEEEKDQAEEEEEGRGGEDGGVDLALEGYCGGDEVFEEDGIVAGSGCVF